MDKLVNNKTSGTDKVICELCKWMDANSRARLLITISSVLDKDEIEQCLEIIAVASIYKKGDSSNLANYRPISLLQSFYKIIPALVKERIDAGIDTWITKTQYGFRHDRSTSQAIFLARRLLDPSEVDNSNLTLILLDWEKAFDKIDHERLIEALSRAGIPNPLLRLIKAIYTEPMFQVEAGGNISSTRRQHTGIRQGCPLSPYLFIIVMTVLFKDVRARLNTPKQNEPIPGIKFAEVLYADDTLLFGTYTRNLNLLHRQIQLESAYYNMKLNVGKCVNIIASQVQSTIKFMDGTLDPSKERQLTLGLSS